MMITYSQLDGFKQWDLAMHHSDPFEEKCAEMRTLLQMPSFDMSESPSGSLLSRENIMNCHELYRKHFHQHYPILHLPTHSFMDASPILLLAMVLAGAYYSSEVIPAKIIPKLALRLISCIHSQQVRDILVITAIH